MDFSRFLPTSNLEEYKGSKIAYWFLIVVALIGTIRSLIHIFAPDGGAFSIAGISVNLEGGQNVIALFGQWGVSQLILAIFCWLAVLKYRFLVPFTLFIVFLEQVLRIGVGQVKPLEAAGPLPGEIGSYILLPLTLAAFLLSLRQVNRDS